MYAMTFKLAVIAACKTSPAFSNNNTINNGCSCMSRPLHASPSWRSSGPRSSVRQRPQVSVSALRRVSSFLCPVACTMTPCDISSCWQRQISWRVAHPMGVAMLRRSQRMPRGPLLQELRMQRAAASWSNRSAVLSIAWVLVYGGRQLVSNTRYSLQLHTANGLSNLVCIVMAVHARACPPPCM